MPWDDLSKDSVARKRIEAEKKRKTFVQEMFVNLISLKLDKLSCEDMFIEELKSILLDSQYSKSHFYKVCEIACAVDSVLGTSLLEQELEINQARQSLMDAALNPTSSLFQALNIQRGLQSISCVITRRGIVVTWKQARSLRRVHRALERSNSEVYIHL